jgi:hypothetical protein
MTQEEIDRHAALVADNRRMMDEIETLKADLREARCAPRVMTLEERGIPFPSEDEMSSDLSMKGWKWIDLGYQSDPDHGYWKSPDDDRMRSTRDAWLKMQGKLIPVPKNPVLR